MMKLVQGVLLTAGLVLAAGQAAAQECFIGEVRMFAGNFAPRGWALCDGQLLSINSNTALFSILGTTYGGDGRTTFGLPGMRGRVPLHAGTGPGLTNRRLGQRAGTETHQPSLAQLMSHSHNLVATAVTATETQPGNSRVLASKTRTKLYADDDTLDPDNPVTMSPESVSSTGGGAPVTNMQPYVALNYIICLQGVFPSRN